MARIAGVDLPREKRVEIGLTYIYGIGRVSADRILEAANVAPSTRVRDLTDDEITGNRMLSWYPSQKRTSCSWTEDKD